MARPLHSLSGVLEDLMPTRGGAVQYSSIREKRWWTRRLFRPGRRTRRVDAVNHFRRARMKAIGNEERGDQRRRCDAEADRHLLHGAGDGTRAAGLFLGDVGIDQRVHAGVLQRAEEPEAERLHHDQPDRRAHSDGCEKQNEQTEDHGVRNQYATIAKAGQNSRHGHLQAHGGDRLRHHEQTGLNRSEPEADLVEERKDERDSADAQAREEAAAHCRAEGANAKQAQRQQWKRGLRRMQSIACQQQDGNRQQPQDFAHAQRMFTEYLQHIRQQRDAGAKQDEADNIEGIGLFAVVR